MLGRWRSVALVVLSGRGFKGTYCSYASAVIAVDTHAISAMRCDECDAKSFLSVADRIYIGHGVILLFFVAYNPHGSLNTQYILIK